MIDEEEYDVDMDYCPLCGAHPFEHGEGEARDEKILADAEAIEELYRRLQRLREGKC